MNAFEISNLWTDKFRLIQLQCNQTHFYMECGAIVVDMCDAFNLIDY